MLPPGLRIPRLAATMMWMKNPFGLMDRCAERFGEPYTMGLVGFPPIVVTVSSGAGVAATTAGESYGTCTGR